MFGNILIATNGCQSAESAVSTGLKLAKQHGAMVHVLYVVDKRPAEPVLHDYRRNVGRETVSAVTKRARDCGVGTKKYIRTGVPSKEISKFANKHAIDLIILGGQDRRWLDRLFMPSVSKNVIRSAHAPVLVVRAASSDERRPDMSVDDSTITEYEPA